MIQIHTLWESSSDEKVPSPQPIFLFKHIFMKINRKHSHGRSKDMVLPYS